MKNDKTQIKRRVVIIHGSFGNSQENWFPWLAEKLRQQGHTVIVPDFPTPERQTVKNWFSVFDERVGPLTRDLIIIGHSLGAAFILRILERSSQPITGTFLVSGFLGELGLPDFDTVNADFVTASVNWERVRRNAGHVAVFHSDSDPYVPLAKGERLAKDLHATLTVLRNAGHINASAGFREFPQLLEEIDKMI